MNLFEQNDFKTQYELAKQTGDRRFGSPCLHTKVKNGRCQKCLRKVVDKRSKR